MTPLQMYFLILLTKLPGLGFFIVFVSAMVLVPSGIIYLITDDVVRKVISKYFVTTLAIFIFGCLINFFGVDLKQLTIIYAVPAVTNNEQVQKLPNNVLNVVNTWLEDQTKK